MKSTTAQETAQTPAEQMLQLMLLASSCCALQISDLPLFQRLLAETLRGICRFEQRTIAHSNAADSLSISHLDRPPIIHVGGCEIKDAIDGKAQAQGLCPGICQKGDCIAHYQVGNQANGPPRCLAALYALHMPQPMLTLGICPAYFINVAPTGFT